MTTVRKIAALFALLALAPLLECRAQETTPEVAGELAELFAIVFAPENAKDADMIALDDARRADAESQASIAATMADVQAKMAAARVNLADIPGKYADAGLTRAKSVGEVAAAQSALADIPNKLATAQMTFQQAVGKYLENVAAYLNIQWDEQAHSHLLKARANALQEARAARQHAEFAKLQAERLPRLLASGGTWTGIRDAWTAYRYTMQRDAVLVAPVLASLTPEGEKWMSARTSAVVPCRQPQDVGTLLHYAATHTLLPVLGTPAWAMLSTLLTALSDAQREKATVLKAEADLAATSARQLEQLDWSRLSK